MPQNIYILNFSLFIFEWNETSMWKFKILGF